MFLVTCMVAIIINGRVEKYHSVVGSTSTIDMLMLTMLYTILTLLYLLYSSYSYELVDNAVIQHVDVDVDNAVIQHSKVSKESKYIPSLSIAMVDPTACCIQHGCS
jgi:hypothetical protein